MSKHTPGPWKYGENPKPNWGYNEIVVRPVGEFPHGRWIADCGLRDDREVVANARLIAAAPDLLDVCQDAYEQIYEDYDGPEHPYGNLLHALREVILKATGENL